ncbi:MAG: hypothetical protein GY870_16780, partial [archaeon]|nr:hypothetical protein [archaeon]
MIEPELIRLLVLKTNPSRHISFRVEEISLLYDEFEKIERIYYGLEEAENDNAKKEIKFLYPLIISKEVSEKCPVQIPFKFLIMMAQLQNLLSIETIIEKVKMVQEGRGISSEISQAFMKKRLDLTVNWLTHLKKMISNEKDGKKQKSLRNKADFFTVPDSITDEIKIQLNENQKESLKLLSKFLENTEMLTEENLKNEMMIIQKNSDIKAKELFQAIYLILIGTKKGPRLGPFMTLLDLKWLKKRFSAV